MSTFCCVELCNTDWCDRINRVKWQEAERLLPLPFGAHVVENMETWVEEATVTRQNDRRNGK